MRNLPRPVVGLTALALAASLGLSACSAKKTAAAASGSSASGNCGTIPTDSPKDPDSVLSSLSSSTRALYNGYPVSVYKSAFADWKPKSGTNKTVGFLISETNNGYQLALESILAGMLKSAGYTVDEVTSSDQVTDQVADFNQMVEQKVAMIVYEPLSSSAFTTAVSTAASAGIPSISLLNSVDSADTVSLGANDWLQGAEMAQYVAKEIGGSGKVLDVHGISGVGIDTATYAGIKAVFAECSGITTDDTIYDQFADSTAKSAVQTYLETHPQKIAAAMTSGAGATGVMEGFQAAGKSVPIIANDSMEDGQLAYWYQNKSSYNGVGITATPPQLATSALSLVNALFKGEGIKVSAVVLNTPLVTDENVAQWYTAGTTTSSTGNAGGPSSLNVLPTAELNELLSNPGS
ncbi:substrate-binding domain-containing protein [Actinospica sp. MGRD01-02]|uniref:Substrate-binding domain-containing protein n=1 Tax=Actinospica acidithermotolerans TaxID=2828514 RepID=A0A941E7I6_9ACTN|nr:substrate-binding domain-containing protein [Actinospica acidithermotolerans]MBR7827780.1 substrate-binding domain-containing protein [Actinospica acidithermotolerans]